MSEILVNTIKKADGTGSLTIPADTGTVVIKDGSNDVTLNNITATGVYLGGTGATNYLDDYEEGTFTVTVTTDGTAFTTANNTATCHYTKVGRMVTVFIDCFIESPTNGTGNLIVTGLPFAYTESQNISTSVRTGRVDLLGDGNGVNAKLNQNNTFLYFSINRNANTDIAIDASYLNNNPTPFMNLILNYTAS